MSSEIEFTQDPTKELYEQTIAETEKAKAFWAQFLTQKEALFALEPRELVESLSDLLNEYIDGVVVEFVFNQQKQPETMVISANGNVDYFRDVMLLVQTAPEIDGIRVEAFRQRVPVERRDFGIQMGEDFSLSSSDILISLEPDETYGRIDIQIYINKEMNEEIEEHAQNMSGIMLDHILGEYDSAVKIDCIDFVEEKTGDEEWIPLPELPEVIDKIWKEQLGHTQDFPQEDQTQWSSFEYQEEDDGEEEGNVMHGMVNSSAHSVACRADLGYCLYVNVSLNSKEQLERIYKLEEALIGQLNPTQLGIHVLSMLMLHEGRRMTVFHTGDVLSSLEILQKTIPQFSDLDIQIDMGYDPCWGQYYQWAPAYQPSVA